MQSADKETKKLLEIILFSTLLFWILQTFCSIELLISKNTTLFSFLYQAPLSTFIPVTTPLSINTLFDLGFTCLLMKFFASFLSPYMGKKSFWTLIISSVYLSTCTALLFVKAPTSFTNALILGLATLFTSLSNGGPLMLLFIPILPRHILLLALGFWFFAPLLVGEFAQAIAAGTSFLLFYIVAVTVYKAHLPFEKTTPLDTAIRRAYSSARAFIEWNILPYFRK